MIKVYSNMKKKYIKPEFETILWSTPELLAGSTQESDFDHSLAPSMMNIPEEDITSEHEE